MASGNFYLSCFVSAENDFMKKVYFYCCMLCICSFLEMACTKNSVYIDANPVENALPPSLNQERKVHYLLYTDKAFSQSDAMITFTLLIRDAQHRILWDSVLAPMRIKDIPTRINKLEVVKSVPDHNSSRLQVGFLYSIENVGYSWYLDQFKEGEAEKVIEYNFH